MLAKIKALVVEDDRMSREMLCTMLGNKGALLNSTNAVGSKNGRRLSLCRRRRLASYNTVFAH